MSQSEVGAIYPLLDKISLPSDLRGLSKDQLPQLCQEIRDFLLDVLSRQPGHLGSSLGAVELTVALHYVYQTPYDRIVWDVGHQAYAHKIITGRKKMFSSLRSWGGLSGFPFPDESVYDTFPAGHASNSISGALGMAVASHLKKENRHVVAVIGDGSMTGGLAFEGLNNASSQPNDLLIILNDNNMSIDANVGGLNKYMVDLNTSKTYNAVRYDIYKGLKKINLLDDGNRRSILRLNNSLKSFFSNNQSGFFDGFGIRYFGPIDGNDSVRLVDVLRRIKDLKGPKILHIRTVKGKGYKPAELSPTIWHAPGKFDVATGKRIEGNSVGGLTKFQTVFGETATELARSDERIVGITPAMPSGCSLNIMMREFPKRSFDVGIAEEHAVTFAAGLAKEGLIPLCNIYSSFAQRAFDQIVHDVALPCYHVVFCLDRSGLVGEDGATHQGFLDMAVLRTVPNLVLSAPMDEHYLRHLMYTACFGQDAPMVIRYPRGTGSQEEWRTEPQILEVGKGRCLERGDSKVALVTIGVPGVTAQAVVRRMKEEGVPVPGHYDMIFVKPIDVELLAFICKTYQHIVTIEDGAVNGGFGSLVLEQVHSLGYQGTVTRLGIPDFFVPHGTVLEQQKCCGLDEDTVYKVVKEKNLDL
ncbi:MAG: 1-deoxy-D-xylulose-5-phosphate synthase [Porphyromonas sp.]|nr:1-deoxy-D-xylulose-5-phosphate synthase [Porphyromonas sp.]